MIVAVVHHLPMSAPISGEFGHRSHILRRPLPRYATSFAFAIILPTSIDLSPTGLQPDRLFHSNFNPLMRQFSHFYSSNYKPRSSNDYFLFIIDD